MEIETQRLLTHNSAGAEGAAALLVTAWVLGTQASSERLECGCFAAHGPALHLVGHT